MSYDQDNFKYDIPIFVLNDPVEYIKRKEVIREEFEDKTIQLELRYLAKVNKIEIKLSDKIIFLMVKAKNLIEEVDNEFDRDKFEILLLYRGKIMKKDQQLGNYLKHDDIVQVFKKNKKPQ